jgi:hypothetical protein
MEPYSYDVECQYRCPAGHGYYSAVGERSGGHSYCDDPGCPECGMTEDEQDDAPEEVE